MRFSKRNAWWGDLATVVTWCMALGLTVGARGAGAAESVASNLDLMTRLTAEVVNELYGKFEGSVSGRSVRLRPFGAGEDYTFVTNVIASELSKQGVEILQPLPPVVPAAAPAGGTGGNAALDAMAQSAVAQPAVGSDELALQYQTVSFGIAYPDVYRSHLVGGKQVRRRADVRLLVTLSDGVGGKVLWVGEAAREHSDEFDHGDAARVEGGTYQFARPVMPAGGWGRFAEPVFVTGIIVGLVYLFFSNQSDN